ncbi:MAG: AAA family ATPase [Oceanisphaera sp.]
MTDTVTPPYSSLQQLLARLLHLSRLDTDFVLLTGPVGAGKSYLAQQLVEQTTLMQPTVLDAKALNSHPRFRHALLSHWFPTAIFDAEEPLANSMERLLPDSLYKRLVVVDNSAWLTDILLQELVQLYTSLPAAVRPFMLLVGEAEWADQVRKQLDAGMLANLLEVEVPSLTLTDQQGLQQALKRQSPLNTHPEAQSPGEVIETTEPKMNIEHYRQLLAQKSVKILLTVLIVVLLLIVIVSLLPSSTQSDTQITPPFEQDQTALPQPVPNDSNPVTTNPELPTNNADQGRAVVQEWPTETLPETPTITTSDAPTRDDSSKERVVIEDDVVSQLMEREALTQQPAKAQPAAKPKPSKSAPAAKASLGTVANLMQKSSQRYTLQLMAGRNKPVLEALAAKHNLSPAWVYPRTMNGEAWFVLVQGDYLSANHARNAIKGLASELQEAKPWPKPFAQVQDEVK